MEKLQTPQLFNDMTFFIFCRKNRALKIKFLLQFKFSEKASNTFAPEYII